MGVLESHLVPVYLNNCQRRDHRRLYGPSAFYDLRKDGPQADKALDLPPGAECVVATPDDADQVGFAWFTFSHEADRPDDEGVTHRVFFGESLRNETMSRADAVKSDHYAVFFNVNGHFKRHSVIPDAPRD